MNQKEVINENKQALMAMILMWRAGKITIADIHHIRNAAQRNNTPLLGKF